MTAPAMAAHGHAEPLANPNARGEENAVRRITAFIAACAMTLTTASAAVAAPPYTGCAVGPNFAGSSMLGSWELMDETEFAAALVSVGYDPALAPSQIAANDKNGDGLVCVMPQTLPNEASGNDSFFVLHDNTQAAP